MRCFRPLFLTIAALAGMVVVQQVFVPIKTTNEGVFLDIHPASYKAASDIYVNRGQDDLAINEWIRLQSLAEELGDKFTADVAVKHQQELHVSMAFTFDNAGHSDLVNAHLSELDRLFDHRLDKSKRDFALGVTFLRLGRNDEAIMRLNKFIGEFPDLAEAEQARQLVSELNQD